jgi:hypothetical protein
VAVREEVVKNLLEIKKVVLEDVEVLKVLQEAVTLVEEDQTNVLLTDQTDQREALVERKDHLVVSEENVEKVKQLKAIHIEASHHVRLFLYYKVKIIHFYLRNL